VEASYKAVHDPTGPGTSRLEYRIIRPDGQVRWVDCVNHVFFGDNGSGPVGTRELGVVLDITERKCAEQALREYATGLESLVESRTQKLQDTITELEHFSYTISHDMRAPLRAMQGFGALLLDQCSGCANPQQLMWLERITLAAGRMDRLIIDALNYTKVVKEQPRLERVDAGTLLRGMLDTYPQFQAPAAEIELVQPTPTVLANEALLTQCFANLLNNAVKFVQPGQVPRIRVHAEKDKGYVRFWFEDNGIGIPKEHQEQIWGMFQRLSHNHEGTGIGLALVKKTVERMGGRTGVESEAGKGSRFWVELRDPDAVVDPAIPPHAGNAGAGRRPEPNLPRPFPGQPSLRD
jgi:signal transduction histidine kinase